MKAPKLTAAAALERPNLVSLADAIDSESVKVLDLTRMLHAIGEVTMGLHNDTNSAADIFAGVAVVADIISDKVQTINEQATELFKAYVGDAR